ncbi:MAG: aryl sulfotransferase [Rhodospirillaceae bacterium]|jgi:hypothetical protein|nr:aryl sulfotransferase [Rhodospirillaceae bacterium]
MRITQTGLLTCDPSKASPGLTLFAPLEAHNAYLLNMAGDTVHEWALGEPVGGNVYLLENGNLLTAERSPEGPTGVNGKGGFIREYDWDGGVVSEYIDHAQHHDMRRLDNGNLLYIGWEEMDPDKATRVQGGIAGTEHNDGSILSDYLKEVTPKGDVVWEWHMQDMEIENYPLHLEVPRAEFAHMNSCFPLPNGDVLVSLRRNSMVAVIDRETKKFNWQMSDLTWGMQHDAQMLDNGNFLFFANGLSTATFPHSRVIELDPKPKEIVWQYKGSPPFSFFSPHISGAQRLANGNTLICEGVWGRFFEVTPEGEIVWEYISPHEFTYFNNDKLNWVFRCYRYTEDSRQINNRVSA